MDSTEWEKARREQNDLLRAQLAALGAGPKERWRRFRLLELVCGGCGDVLLEVMNTSPYRVVLVHGADPHPKEPEPNELPPEATLTGKELYERYGGRVRIRRSRDRRFVVLPHELSTVSASESLAATCRCRQWVGRTQTLVADLQRGIKRRVVPPTVRRSE